MNILVTISELVKQSRRQDTDLHRGAKRTRESKDRRGAAVSRYRAGSDRRSTPVWPARSGVERKRASFVIKLR